MTTHRELLDHTPLAWVWAAVVVAVALLMVASIPFRLAPGDVQGALMAAVMWVVPLAMLLAADRRTVVRVDRVGDVLRCRYLLHTVQVPLADVRSVRWSWFDMAAVIECSGHTLRLQGSGGHGRRVRRLQSWAPHVEVR